jgi:hypothetical protein
VCIYSKEFMTAQDPISKPTSQDDSSHVDSYQPPTKDAAPITPITPTASTTPAAPTTPPAASADKSESLQDQNIFYLLGVTDGTDEEKEAFLDELQQVIWEDFIESDVKTLISEEEMTQLRQIMAKGDSQDVQEEMVVYLEKLIPDLEDIMLEKALELKEEMMWERIAGMREYYSNKPESLTKLNEAEQLIKKDRWHQATEVLNAIGQ